MLAPTRLAFVVLASTLLTPLALAQHAHFPTPSTWVLSPSESNFGDGPAEKSDTFVVLTDTDKQQKWSDTFVDAEGKTWHYSWSGPADGTLLPVKGITGISYSVDAATDTSVETYPDGTVQTCKFALSADKKKFMDSCTAKSKTGQEFPQTIVFNRSK